MPPLTFDPLVGFRLVVLDEERAGEEEPAAEDAYEAGDEEGVLQAQIEDRVVLARVGIRQGVEQLVGGDAKDVYGR